VAQRIIGLDLGSYSLKAVHLDSTFRGFQLVDYKERRVAAGTFEAEGSAADLEAVESWLKGEPTGPETVVCAIPGDFVLTRFLSFPFRDRKRIAEVVGFELEDHIPYDIDEVVYDYQVIAQGDDSSKILAVAVPRERLEPFLQDLKAVGVDPKVLSFGPWAYVNLVPHLSPAPHEAIAIVDLGHRRTDVCVVRDGAVEFVRTLNRAGAHLNDVIAKQLEIDVYEADARKKLDGRLPLRTRTGGRGEGGAFGQDDETAQLPALGEGGAHAAQRAALEQALEAGVLDVVRDVRLALVAHHSEVGRTVDRVFLCGGTAQLPGIQAFFEQHLGVPVAQLDVSRLEFNRMGDRGEGAAIVPKGLALSLGGLGSRSEINLRRGPYAYVGEFRFLRDRLTAIVLMVLALLSIAGFRAYTRHESLSAQRESQLQEVRTISKELLGREVDDAEALLRVLRTTPDEQDTPFPEITAFDLFADISGIIEDVKATPRAGGTDRAGEGTPGEGEAAVDKPPEPAPDELGLGDEEDEDLAPPAEGGPPPDDRYVVELETLRIDKANGSLKGQANDIEAYELFLAKLKEHRCLKKVETQTTEIVTFQRHTGWRDFQLKFSVDCSEKKATKTAKAGKGAKGAAATGEEGVEAAPAAPAAEDEEGE